MQFFNRKVRKMKKYVIMIFALLVSSSLWAQEINLGVKGGLNVAGVGGDTDVLESRLGFHLGGYAEIGFNEMFSLQPELLYSKQGAQSVSTSEVKLNLDYLTIPLLAKVTLTEELSGYLGPQIGFVTNAEVKDNEGSDKVTSEYKSTDLGLAVGLGYELDNGLNFSARYTHGLSNIDNVFNNAAEYKEHNQVFQVSVGYKLNR